MRKHMRGWTSPHLEKLISATQPDAMLLSHIYQRQALLHRCLAEIYNALLILGGLLSDMTRRVNAAV